MRVYTGRSNCLVWNDATDDREPESLCIYIYISSCKSVASRGPARVGEIASNAAAGWSTRAYNKRLQNVRGARGSPSRVLGDEHNIIYARTGCLYKPRDCYYVIVYIIVLSSRPAVSVSISHDRLNKHRNNIQNYTYIYNIRCLPEWRPTVRPRFYDRV